MFLKELTVEAAVAVTHAREERRRTPPSYLDGERKS